MNLRHVIVHNKGIVSDKGKFIKKVLEDSRLDKNKKLLERHTNFIETFFGSGEDKNMVPSGNDHNPRYIPFLSQRRQ